jgi:hypothetical protein
MFAFDFLAVVVTRAPNPEVEWFRPYEKVLTKSVYLVSKQAAEEVRGIC